MPIYEYECDKCGHHIEALQRFSDSALTDCDLCNGKMKKLISQSTFHLKGTGWYVTDYASKSGSNHGGKAQKDASNATETTKVEAKSSTDSSSKKDTSSSSKGE